MVKVIEGEGWEVEELPPPKVIGAQQPKTNPLKLRMFDDAVKLVGDHFAQNIPGYVSSKAIPDWFELMAKVMPIMRSIPHTEDVTGRKVVYFRPRITIPSHYGEHLAKEFGGYEDLQHNRFYPEWASRTTWLGDEISMLSHFYKLMWEPKTLISPYTVAMGMEFGGYAVALALGEKDPGLALDLEKAPLGDYLEEQCIPTVDQISEVGDTYGLQVTVGIFAEMDRTHKRFREELS